MPCTKWMIAVAIGVLFPASLALADAQTAAAQQPPAAPATSAADTGQPPGGTPTWLRPETPEQRKARVGTAEDPGPNPDPSKHFWRFGTSYHIERFDRRFAVYTGGEDGFIRPFGFVNAYKELYQQNEKYVWCWIEDPQPEEAKPAPPAPASSKYSPSEIEYFRKIRSEFTELTPRQGTKTIHFVESSQGLPTSGSFRNSLAVADMNGDGFPDLIVPPQRPGGTTPLIYLGDGKGHWKFWDKVRWPQGLDYGSVVAADFNKDGKMDLAFAVHLKGVYVFLGDNEGHFTEVTEHLPRDFATRRLIATDVDHDGWPDLVAISEGPAGAFNPQQPTGGSIRAFLNRKKGTMFEPVDISDPGARLGGDWLASGSFNGDPYPDFAAASVFFSSTAIVWNSVGPLKWKQLPDPDGKLVPYLSYYFANAAGKFSSKNRDDLIISYTRFWPPVESSIVPEPPSVKVTGIDRISFAGKEPTRTPIVRWDSNRGIWGLAVGDFDGDGNLDIAYTRYDPRELVILLGDGKGGFTRAKVDGIKLAPNTNYDLKVADVNGDGRPDIIIMYESSGTSSFAVRDGSIHVYLNEGETSPAPEGTPGKK